MAALSDIARMPSADATERVMRFSEFLPRGKKTTSQRSKWKVSSPSKGSVTPSKNPKTSTSTEFGLEPDERSKKKQVAKKVKQKPFTISEFAWLMLLIRDEPDCRPAFWVRCSLSLKELSWIWNWNQRMHASMSLKRVTMMIHFAREKLLSRFLTKQFLSRTCQSLFALAPTSEPYEMAFVLYYRFWLQTIIKAIPKLRDLWIQRLDKDVISLAIETESALVLERYCLV